jgi:hypothetical protein
MVRRTGKAAESEGQHCAYGFGRSGRQISVMQNKKPHQLTVDNRGKQAAENLRMNR